MIDNVDAGPPVPRTLPPSSHSGDRVCIQFDCDSHPDLVIATIHADPAKHINRDAKLSISAKAIVHDNSGINKELLLFEQSLTIRSESTEIQIPRTTFKNFVYSGKMLSIGLHGRLKIEDGVFFDTKLEEELAIKLSKQPSVATDSKELIDPTDCINFVKNFAAVPLLNKITTSGLGVVALVIILVNTFIGYHDQVAPGRATYVYSHQDSKGHSNSPLLNALMLNGGAGVVVWLAIKRQLRSYMKFAFKSIPSEISADTVVNLKDLVTGSSRIDLENILIRVVACNMEKGQYERGSGSNRRTMSFSEPVCGVCLFQIRLSSVPKKTPIEDYLNYSFSFEPMFNALYPPNFIADTHGLFVYWEVQLIHDQLADQELIGPVDNLRVEDLYRSTRNGEKRIQQPV